MQPSSYLSTVNTVTINIPVKKNKFVLLFCPLWLVGWFVGETSVMGELTKANSSNFPTVFLSFWLFGWTIGGFAISVIWLWNMIGTELVQVSRNTLAVSKKIGPFGRQKTVDINLIQIVRFSPPVASFRAQGIKFSDIGFRSGSIEIKVKNSDSLRVANYYEEDEAQPFVAEINKAFHRHHQ